MSLEAHGAHRFHRIGTQICDLCSVEDFYTFQVQDFMLLDVTCNELSSAWLQWSQTEDVTFGLGWARQMFLLTANRGAERPDSIHIERGAHAFHKHYDDTRPVRSRSPLYNERIVTTTCMTSIRHRCFNALSRITRIRLTRRNRLQ